MILGICDNPEILKVMMLIKIVISAICVAVPIILIVVLMLDYAKAVSSNDNDMVMKVTRNLPYRLIAVAVIEVLQPIFGRAFDMNDIILNSLGIVVSTTILMGAKKIIKR